jgi:hypothetical protein
MGRDGHPARAAAPGPQRRLDRWQTACRRHGASWPGSGSGLGAHGPGGCAGRCRISSLVSIGAKRGCSSVWPSSASPDAGTRFPRREKSACPTRGRWWMVRLSRLHQFPISDGCCAPPLWRGSAFLGFYFGVSPANRRRYARRGREHCGVARDRCNRENAACINNLS